MPAPSQHDDVTIIQAQLPVTAVQALYNAVTGKTENLSRAYFENFIVRWKDVSQLHFTIMQQLQHYDLVSPPTVTAKVTFNNQESQ